MTISPCFWDGNLLTNGGFESDLTDWTINTGSPLVITHSHAYNDGTKVLSLGLYDNVYHEFLVEAGKSYRIRFYIEFLSEIILRDTWYVSIVQMTVPFITPIYYLDYATWEFPSLTAYFEDTFTIPSSPSGTTTCRIYINGYSGVDTSENSIYVDTASIGLIDTGTCEGDEETLVATPSSLVFYAIEGEANPDTQRVKISGPELYYDPNSGPINMCIDWAITAISNDRITSDKMSGSTDCNDAANMPNIAYNTQGLSVGEYSDTITITGDYTTLNIPVKCYVLPIGSGTYSDIDIPCVFISGE